VCVCERERDRGRERERERERERPLTITSCFRHTTWEAYSAQFKNNHFPEMCCGSEAASYSRLIDSCITHLKAQGPSLSLRLKDLKDLKDLGGCNESKEEEEDLLVDEGPAAPGPPPP